MYVLYIKLQNNRLRTSVKQVIKEYIVKLDFCLGFILSNTFKSGFLLSYLSSQPETKDLE